MFKGYKVNYCIKAGRKDYLEIHTKYVEKNKDLIDKCSLFNNAYLEEDREYIKTFTDHFYKIIERPKKPQSYETKGRTVSQFFNECVDKDTIYIMADDDIVYMRPDAIYNLLDYRITYKDYFIIYPNVINNSLISYLHIKMNNIPLPTIGIPEYRFDDKTLLFSSNYAYSIHKKVIEDIKNNDTDKYLFKEWVLYHHEFVPANLFCFFGEDFNKYLEEMSWYYEEDLNIKIPKKYGRFNSICGKSFFVHHAYLYQRKELLEDEKKANEKLLLNDYKLLANL